MIKRSSASRCQELCCGECSGTPGTAECLFGLDGEQAAGQANENFARELQEQLRFWVAIEKDVADPVGHRRND